MKKTKALDVITSIVSAMREQPTSREDLLGELQSMRFTVTPVSGDISSMSWEQGQFLESLWSFGKIDQIIRSNYSHMEESERERLMDFIAQYEESLSENRVETPLSDTASVLQLEIVRETLTANSSKSN